MQREESFFSAARKRENQFGLASSGVVVRRRLLDTGGRQTWRQKVQLKASPFHGRVTAAICCRTFRRRPSWREYAETPFR